jgi:hypothetical protein
MSLLIPPKVDRTFLETSSALAAHELKKFYQKMGAEVGPGRGPLGNLYVITAFEVNGEKKFRLRYVSSCSSQQEPIIFHSP